MLKKIDIGSPLLNKGKITQKNGIFYYINGTNIIKLIISDKIPTYNKFNKYITLKHPYGICIDNYNNLYVSDIGTDKIYHFNDTGTMLNVIGSHSNPQNKYYKFNKPHAIKVANNDDVIIADTYNNCIKVFDKEYNYKLSFNGSFKRPLDICIDSDDNIIVADTGNNRLQIYNSNYILINIIDDNNLNLKNPVNILATRTTIIVNEQNSTNIKIIKYNELVFQINQCNSIITGMTYYKNSIVIICSDSMILIIDNSDDYFVVKEKNELEYIYEKYQHQYISNDSWKESAYTELIDPITLNLLDDPYIASDGITYSKETLENMFMNCKSNSYPRGPNGIHLELINNCIGIPNIKIKQLLNKFKNGKLKICDDL
jgi:hypothetical protein